MSHMDGVLFNCMPKIPMDLDESIVCEALCRAGHGFAASLDEVMNQMPATYSAEKQLRGYLHSLIRKGYVWGIPSEADDEDDLYVPCSVRGVALKVSTGFAVSVQ